MTYNNHFLVIDTQTMVVKAYEGRTCVAEAILHPDCDESMESYLKDIDYFRMGVE